MQFLGENQIPFCLVFTKADKLGSSKLNKQISAYKKILLDSWETLPMTFLTSSSTGLGRKEFLDFIGGVNEDVAKDFK